MREPDYVSVGFITLLVLMAVLGIVAVVAIDPAPKTVVVEPVVVEKVQSLVPRSSDRGLTPEARELWYRCVDLWEACEYASEWGPDGMLAQTACENKVKDCHMLVSEANR